MIDKFEYRRYTYYILIVAVSLFTLIFLPMLGTDLTDTVQFPDTRMGWAIWAVIRLIVSVLNIIIFDCFIRQGKLNVKDDPRFLEALRLDGQCQRREIEPRSPQTWLSKQYAFKSSTLVIGSLMSTLVLTNAILTYDYVSLITYAFTIALGVIFGVMQMRAAEDYWTSEYPLWAQKRYQEEHNNAN